MSIRQRFVALTVGACLASSALVLSTSPASAASEPANGGTALGSQSLASVLLSDGNRFDHNGKDFDIVTEAVLAVLQEKPNSPVKVLTDGSVPLTAFVPNDEAFRFLAEDLTDKWMWNESKVFSAVASLGIPAVESVLLYHVVPGVTIDSGMAVKADGASVPTANGKSFTVDVGSKKGVTTVRLVDLDDDERNPRVRVFDVNKGNMQIAHGIDRVLLPLDL